MNKKKILNMTLFAVFASISVVLGLVPNLGYINLGFGSITIVHIPVLIGVMFLPLSYSLALGLVFGLTSLLASFIYASNPFDYAFQNPLISVLPRVLFALAAYYIFHGFKRIFGKLKNGNYYSFIVISVVTILFLFFTSRGIHQVTGWDLNIIYIVASLFLILLHILYYYFLMQEKYQNLAYIPSVFITASLVHSFIVLTLVGLIKPTALGGGDVFGTILTLMSSFSLFEALIAVLIGSPIVVALYNIKENEGKNNDIDVWCW